MATALSAEFLAASAEGPNSSWPKEGRVPPQQPMVRRLRKKALQGLIVSAVECRGASTIRVKLGGRIEADRLMRCPSAVRPSTIPRSLRSASAVRSTWPGSAGAAGRKRTQPVEDRVQPPSRPRGWSRSRRVQSPGQSTPPRAPATRTRGDRAPAQDHERGDREARGDQNATLNRGKPHIGRKGASDTATAPRRRWAPPRCEDQLAALDGGDGAVVEVNSDHRVLVGGRNQAADRPSARPFQPRRRHPALGSGAKPRPRAQTLPSLIPANRRSARAQTQPAGSAARKRRNCQRKRLHGALSRRQSPSRQGGSAKDRRRPNHQVQSGLGLSHTRRSQSPGARHGPRTAVGQERDGHEAETALQDRTS